MIKKQIEEGVNNQFGVLITARQVTRMCGISRSTLYKLVSSGKAPKPIKVGRSSRWLETEIREWIAYGCPDIESLRKIKNQ